MERRTCLNVDRLDERIVPNHGKSENAAAPLGLVIETIETIFTKVKENENEIISLERQIIRRIEREIVIDVIEDPAGGATGISSDKITALVSLPVATADAAKRVDVPPRAAAIPIWSEGFVHGVDGEPELVRVAGPPGVQTRDDHMQFVSTNVPHSPPPTVVFLDLMGASDAPGGSAAAPPTEAETIVPIESNAPTGPAAQPDAVVQPELKPAGAVARFMPFSPAALESAVRRFVDGLKSDDRDGMPLAGKVVAWTAVIAGGIFAGELARRKKLPQKAVWFLSLSKYLTRTKTK
jgi:hypothetical protein